LTCIKMVSNRVIMLIDGKNYASGTYEDLQNVSDPKVREFFD
jgi:phospholipid/cholesterol/gamma-HCH transport system ATP-binding protein